MNDLKINNRFIIVFVSVLFVSLIFNLCIRNEIDFSYLNIDISDVSGLTLQGSKISIKYVVYKRIKQFVLVFVLIKGFGVDKIFNLLTVVGGGLIGLMVSVQVYYQGLTGLIILFGCTLPHYVLYYFGMYYSYKNKMFKSGYQDNLKKIIMVCLIFVTGLMLELFFMTIFLKNFYQYMVS